MDLSYFIHPLIVASISGLLAAVIAGVDRVVNNYGEVTVSLNSGKKEVKIKGGNSLLSSLAESKIFLPSACGGRGSCGACKCLVESGAGQVLPTEMPYLSPDELNGGTRLACQVKVKSDISIRVPEQLFNIRKFEGTVTRIIDLTHDIKEV